MSLKKEKEHELLSVIHNYNETYDCGCSKYGYLDENARIKFEDSVPNSAELRLFTKSLWKYHDSRNYLGIRGSCYDTTRR
jgi:hypothetical protein